MQNTRTFAGVPVDEALEVVELFHHLRGTPFYEQALRTMRKQDLRRRITKMQNELRELEKDEKT